MSFFVYMWTCTETGKSYVGKGCGDRVVGHFRPSSKSLLAQAARKHGRDSMRLRMVAEGLEEGHAFAVEKVAIAAFRTVAPYGYNIAFGGEGASGVPCSEQRKASVSRVHKGRVKSPEECRKLSEAHKTRPPMSAETRAKITKSNLSRDHTYLRELAAKRTGVPLSPERIERLRAANTGKTYGRVYKRAGDYQTCMFLLQLGASVTQVSEWTGAPKSTLYPWYRLARSTPEQRAELRRVAREACSRSGYRKRASPVKPPT